MAIIPHSRDNILADLRAYAIEVHFMKQNGQKRIMRCTLMPELLPKEYINEENIERQYHAQNPNTIRAYDLDVKEWRSFRIDSVEWIQALDSTMFHG
jgi:hypothetical protein